MDHLADGAVGKSNELENETNKSKFTRKVEILPLQHTKLFCDTKINAGNYASV